MTRYLSPEVEAIRDNPTTGATVRVAIVGSVDPSHIREEVAEYDGSVVRELPSGVVVAELEEQQLDEFCDYGGIESVSLSDQMRVLS